MTAPKGAVVEEERGHLQVRWYPECTVCGWYPLHERQRHDAVAVAAAHNRTRHPGVRTAVVSGVDVYAHRTRRKK